MLLLLAAIVLGWLAWQDSRQAKVLVKWSTASELNTAGYNLQRSESPDGPFIKINTTLIPASSNALTGSDYSYEDQDAQSGKTYYYRLEEVELDGSLGYFGPISVEADGAPGTGLYISLGVIILGVAGGAVMLYHQRRTPVSAAKKSIGEGEL